MDKREKVIRGLEACNSGDCDHCPYCKKEPRKEFWDDEAEVCRADEMRNDALEILKAPGIIRCAECKHWHTNCMENAGRHGCDVIGDYTGPEYFCASAERRNQDAPD